MMTGKTGKPNMGRETQGRGRQTVTLTLPPPLPPRHVPRRMTSKGGGGGWRSGGLKDLEIGQVASRAVPVPGVLGKRRFSGALARSRHWGALG